MDMQGYTLREYVDSLSPEQFAREAKEAAETALLLAQLANVPLPASIQEMMDTPLEELADQRRRAMLK